MKEIQRKNVSQLCIRLVLGIGFIIHGWAKLKSGNPDGFEKLLIQIGVPFPHLTAWTTALTELIGGVAILLGFFVEYISVPLIATMLAAMFMVQIRYGFSSVKTLGLTVEGPIFGPPGYEINLVYIACLIFLILTGAGEYSLDYFLRKKKKRTDIV